jgi:hypothetical protein
MDYDTARRLMQRLMQRVFLDRTNMLMIAMALLILLLGSYAILG